jgi:Response regulator containing a CheY-like receiver domain and an HTH DNA-binding domain
MKKVVSIAVSMIEDDVPAREIIAGWIRRAEGFRLASEHGTAESALAKLPDEKPDVVLADINLPGLSGIECIRRLKPVLPNTQFVMVTVYEDADHIFNALAVGASGYLLKQTAANDLLKAIREVQKGNAFFSPTIAKRLRDQCREAFANGQPVRKSIELTSRESEVLQLIAEGFSNKQIAAELCISIKTVEKHRQQVMNKLNIHDVAGLTRYALSKGLVDRGVPAGVLA